MFRLAVAGILGLAVLFAVIVLMPQSVVARFLSGVPLLVALAALLVAVAAVAVALRSMRDAAALRSDIFVLARSIDIALKDVVSRTDREAATLDDMTGVVSREIERLSERIAARDEPAAAQADGSSNVVPYPSARRLRGQAAAENRPQPPADPDAVGAAWRKAIAAGEFDISLQPIISVALGSAAGFEVFANLPLENGQRFDLRRPAEPVSPADAATFERILLTTALQAGRKRLGAASASMPLHVAISEALLSNSRELDTVMEILQFYPDLAQSFVISAPAGLVESHVRHRQALGLFAARSVRMSVEGWIDAANPVQPAATAGFSFVKIPTNRLLDRERSRRRLAPAATMLDQAEAANLTVIATEVVTDEDAVTLIDLGIDLMSGPRFGGPKRFKPDGGGRPGKLALI